MSDPYTFEYDHRFSFTSNFINWYQVNCEERSAYNEKLYSENEGLDVFREMYGEFEKMVDKSYIGAIIYT